MRILRNRWFLTVALVVLAPLLIWDEHFVFGLAALVAAAIFFPRREWLLTAGLVLVVLWLAGWFRDFDIGTPLLLACGAIIAVATLSFRTR